jgi:hypothetical protein
MDEPSPKLSSDRPIDKAADDALNRAGFSKRLANAIRSAPGDESLVLALYGPWGSGKSSIKNMMLEELRSDDWTCPIILEFNPWRLGEESQLLVSFFSDVTKKLTEYSETLATKNGIEAKEIANAKARVKTWKKYGRYVAFGGTTVKAASTVMAMVGVPGSPLLNLLGSTLAASGELIDHAEESAREAAENDTETLEEIREELRKSFESDDLKKNVLVIVDDLDRLSQGEIVQMVRLIKANTDFPRFVFLLLCEEDRIAKAHDEVAGGEGFGRRYLEKIVQIPFRVPAPDRSDTRQYFNNGLGRVISNLSLHAKGIWDDTRDQERFSRLFEKFLRPNAENLRSVNRYLNTLGLGMAAFVEDSHFNANPIDVMAIEALKVFEPDAYEQLVQSSRMTLLGIGSDLFANEKTEAKALLEAILDRAVSKERVKELVLLLFPTIHKDLGFGGYGDLAELEWRRDLRICTNECFDRYFALDLRASDLKESQFNELVGNVGSPQALEASLRNLGEDGKLGKLLFRLEASQALEVLSTDDRVSLFAELFNLAPVIPEYKGFVMTDDGKSQVFVLLRGHLRGRSEQENREVILGITERVKNFSSSAYMLARFESTLRSHEIAGLAPSGAILDEAASIVLQQIEAAGEAGTLIDAIEQWPGMLDWWHKRSPDEAKKFLTNSLRFPRVTAAFLRSCSGRVSSDRRTFDYVDLKGVEEVVSVEEVEEAIKQIDPHELESQKALKDLVSRFLFALDRRRRGLSTNGSDMAFESERI